MKVFISQPMRGKDYEQIISERVSIKNKIRTDFGNDIEFIDNLFLDELDNPLKALIKSLSLLSGANCAVFVGEWYMYPGCSIEHQCCVDYGIPILKYYKEVNP